MMVKSWHLPVEDHLYLKASEVTVDNKGKAAVNFSAQSMIVQGSRRGTDGTYAVALNDCSLDADVQQKLPKDKGSVDIKGHMESKQFTLGGVYSEASSQFSTNIHRLEVSTEDKSSKVQIGSVSVVLPAGMAGNIENLKVKTNRDQNDRHAEVTLTQLNAQGQGTVSINTEKREMKLPVHGAASSSGAEIDWHSQPEGSHGQTTSTLNIHPHNFSLDNLQLDHVQLKKAKFDVDDSMSGYVALDGVEVLGDQLLGPNSPVSEKYRRYIPESALKGRRLKLTLNLPVKNGLIDPSEIEVKDLQFDHVDADNESWTGWGAKKLFDGTESCRIDGITVSNGRLWLSTQIKTRLKTFNLWMPMFKVPGYEYRDERKLLLPELLHGLTGCHFTPVNRFEQVLLKEARDNHPELIDHLTSFCEQAGADKACQILKQININHWIEQTRLGNAKYATQLKGLSNLFQRYPETAGKALAICLIDQWPVTDAELKHFCSEPVAAMLDPVALAELLIKEGQTSDAYDVVHHAAEKYPNNARLAYFDSVMAQRLSEATAPEVTTPEIAATFERVIIIQLTRAARLGYPDAIQQLQNRAARGQPLAELGLAGITLTKNKRPADFYKAITDLENLIAHKDVMTEKYAEDMLLKRARNAGKIFIHADEESDDILARQHAIIEDGEAEELSGDELYLWGLRYLYAVEGVKRNRPRSSAYAKNGSNQRR